MKKKVMGQNVYHDLFGKGKVVSCSNIYITVAFGNENKSFMFPDSFLTFLKAENESLQKELVQLSLTDAEPKKCFLHEG